MKNFSLINSEKITFSNIFILAALTLMILPFLTSATDLLTRLLTRFEIYRWIQDTIIPYEMSILKTTLNFLGFDNLRYGRTFIEVLRDGRWEAVYFS